MDLPSSVRRSQKRGHENQKGRIRASRSQSHLVIAAYDRLGTSLFVVGTAKMGFGFVRFGASPVRAEPWVAFKRRIRHFPDRLADGRHPWPDSFTARGNRSCCSSLGQGKAT